ncbi:MAG TPA: nitroreductase family protein [Telluria sp.]|nr:nitroreductase family protein [Telluria sp.]
MRLSTLIIMSTSALYLASQAAEPIRLPPPDTHGGMPLMQALSERHSAREFAARALPRPLLSNLLWAAYGINRPKDGGRTAPSAHDVQEMEVYVVLPEAVYRYDGGAHALVFVHGGDWRALTGRQDFAALAPLNLVYVADYVRFARDPEPDKQFYAAADAGHISENVYLFCASERLACVTRAYIDRPALAKALGLRPTQHIVLAQSVGYPVR